MSVAWNNSVSSKMNTSSMEADPSVTYDALVRHWQEGLNWQKRYNVALRLSYAMDVVDILVDQLKNESHWKICDCD